MGYSGLAPYAQRTATSHPRLRHPVQLSWATASTAAVVFQSVLLPAFADARRGRGGCLPQARQRDMEHLATADDPDIRDFFGCLDFGIHVDLSPPLQAAVYDGCPGPHQPVLDMRLCVAGGCLVRRFIGRLKNGVKLPRIIRRLILRSQIATLHAGRMTHMAEMERQPHAAALVPVERFPDDFMFRLMQQ